MKLTRTRILASLVSVALVSLARAHAEPGNVPLATVLDSVKPDNIRADLFFIASDELAGRDTPSNGQRVAARFIRDRLQRLGWQPGFKDQYLYEWSRDGGVVLDDAETKGTFGEGKSAHTLVFGTDVFVNANKAQDFDASGPLVFCGDGSKKDFEGKKLAGKWALVYESAVGTKEREKSAKAAGAIGVAVTTPPDFKGEAYESHFKGDTRRLVKGTFGGSSKKDDEFEPTVFLAPSLFADLKPATWRQGQELGTLHEKLALKKIVLENVCGFWPGSDPVLKNEVIIISAHYDHVGVGSDGQIYNGADDNGSGTCGLMAIAEALTVNGPMARSVFLMWVSGEEKGLWGSEAWTKHPWLPDGCHAICDINIDMIGRNAPEKLLITPTKARKEYNGLVSLAEKNGPLEGFPTFLSADEYWARSDQMNFSVNLKIPVTFLFDDVHEDYHKPTDKPDKIDYDKIRRVVRLVLRMLDGMQEKDLDLSTPTGHH